MILLACAFAPFAADVSDARRSLGWESWFVVRPVRWLVSLQAALVLSFSLILALKEPLLLASPFGMLSKNLQFLCVLYVLFLVEKHGSWTDLAKRYLRIGMAVVWLTEGLFPNFCFSSRSNFRWFRESNRTIIASISSVLWVWHRFCLRLRLCCPENGCGFLLLLQAGALCCCRCWWVLEPSLYVHPFGPFSKNLPIFVGTLVVRKQCGGLS